MPSCYIERVGQGDDIVFLHGWGANCRVWQPLYETLKERHSCYLVDLPGFGAAQQNRVLDFDVLIEELVQQLPDQAIYCGWSLGGLIAMQMAVKHPHKVKKLVTISSSPCFVAKGDWPGIEADLMSGFIQGIEESSMRTLKRFIGLQSLNSCSAKDDRKFLQNVLNAYDFPQYQALRMGLTWLDEIDLRTEVSQIQQPWTAFFSENDAIVPEQTMSALSALNEDIKVSHLSQVGHFPFISYAQQIIFSLV